MPAAEFKSPRGGRFILGGKVAVIGLGCKKPGRKDPDLGRPAKPKGSVPEANGTCTLLANDPGTSTLLSYDEAKVAEIPAVVLIPNEEPLASTLETRALREEPPASTLETCALREEPPASTLALPETEGVVWLVTGVIPAWVETKFSGGITESVKNKNKNTANVRK